MTVPLIYPDNNVNWCKFIIGEDFYGDMVKSERVGDETVRLNFFTLVCQFIVITKPDLGIIWYQGIFL